MSFLLTRIGEDIHVGFMPPIGISLLSVSVRPEKVKLLCSIGNIEFFMNWRMDHSMPPANLAG